MLTLRAAQPAFRSAFCAVAVQKHPLRWLAFQRVDNDCQRQEALQRLAQGETQADIARTYNVDTTTIGRLEPRPFEHGPSVAVPILAWCSSGSNLAARLIPGRIFPV